MAKKAAKVTEPSSQGLTRGHKKKARTRKQLLKAALRIYARKGAGELALNELAEEAGVSNGTVYNYFRSREDVVSAVGIALAEQLSEQVTAISQGLDSGAERLAVGVRTFVRQAIDDPQWASALVSVVNYAEGMRSVLADNVRGDLQAGLRQGDFCYADESMALMLVVSASTGAMTALVEGRQVPEHDAVIAEMILLALGVPRAEAHRLATRPLPVPAT